MKAEEAYVSKHARGHRGQKARAKAHRRGTSGAARRRRFLATRKEQVRTRARYASLGEYRRGPHPSQVIHDEEMS